MQMITHGISTGALFILAGSLYERIHTRDILRMGGFWSQTPFMAVTALIFAMASLGLPGLGNFVAEFLTLIGSWSANRPLTVLAAVGLVGATAYSLRIMQKVFLGPVINSHHEMKDLSLREKLIFVPMIIVIVWLGVFPSTILDTSKVPIRNVLGNSENTQANTPAKEPVHVSLSQKGGSHE